MHLKELTLADGVSGNEDEVRGLITGLLDGVGCEYRVDRLGNVIAHNRGRSGGGRILLSAHMDEVGLMAAGADADGNILFRTVGGISPLVMSAKTVAIGEGKLRGVTNTVSPDTLGGGGASFSAEDAAKFYIDIGASSREEAENAVKMGDYISFVSDYVTFGDRLVKAKALDDRVGCSILLDLLELRLDRDFYCAFTVMEEVGLRGARCAARGIEPETVCVVEATLCADFPDVKSPGYVTRLGGGPALSLCDGAAIYDAGETARLAAAAERLGIPWQYRRTGRGGTEAGAYQESGAGCRVLGVSIPCRNMHSSATVISLYDYDNTLKLLSEYLLSR